MKFIIATHGKFASGICSSIKLLAGDGRDIICIDAYVDEKDFSEQLLDAIKNVDDKLLIFTDMAGGSVNREVMMTLRDRDAYIITDFNLALILELYCKKDEDINEEMIKSVVETAKTQIRYFKMGKEN